MKCYCTPGGIRLVYDRIDRDRITLACPACDATTTIMLDDPEGVAACREFVGQIQEDLKKEAAHCGF